MNTGRSLLDIGWRLRATLDAMGVKQAELSRRTGGRLDPPRINNWIKGTARPDIDAALLICDTLGVTLDWIYRGDLSKLPGELQTKIAADNRPLPIIGTHPLHREKRAARKRPTKEIQST